MFLEKLRFHFEILGQELEIGEDSEGNVLEFPSVDPTRSLQTGVKD